MFRQQPGGEDTLEAPSSNFKAPRKPQAPKLTGSPIGWRSRMAAADKRQEPRRSTEFPDRPAKNKIYLSTEPPEGFRLAP